MASITLQGNKLETAGSLPAIGSAAPDFKLLNGELGEVSLKDYQGKKLVLNIFPSIDTGVCATSVRRFNQEAAKLPGVQVLCISADLPFALGRFCAAEGIKNVATLSAFLDPSAAPALARITASVWSAARFRVCCPGPWWSSMQAAGSSTPSRCRNSPRNRTTMRPWRPSGNFPESPQ